jgi:hypothetical protein
MDIMVEQVSEPMESMLIMPNVKPDKYNLIDKWNKCLLYYEWIFEYMIIIRFFKKI